MADQLDRERLRTLKAARAVLNLITLYLLLPIVALVIGAVALAGWWVINQ